MPEKDKPVQIEQKSLLPADINLNDTSTLVPALCLQSVKEVEQEVQNHFDTTIFPQLSTQFLQLSAFKQHTNLKVAEILSSLQSAQNELVNRLTALPFHPYDKYKRIYYRPSSDQQPVPTLESLPIPKDFVPMSITKQITALNEKYIERTLAQVAFLSCNPEAMQDPAQMDKFCNAFSYPVEGKFMIDLKEASNHMHFLETVKGLDYHEVMKDPVTSAKKLLNFYIEMYS